MSHAFTNVDVTHLQTGETFPHTSYTTSTEESIALARLTFPATLWEITANIFDQILDRVPEVRNEVIPQVIKSTVSYQTGLFE